MDRIRGWSAQMVMNRLAMPLMVGAALVGLSGAGCGEDEGGFARVEGSSLVAFPEALTFTDVALGQESIELLTITNTGEGEVTFQLQLGEERTRLDSQREFSWGANTVDETYTLGPQESVTVEVAYTPQDSVPDTGRVVVDYDGPDLEIPLDTPNISPQIDAAPPRVTFGRVPAGERGERIVKLQNVGNAPLTITELVWESPSPELSFCFNDLYTEGECAAELAGGEITLAPFADVAVKVTYLPEDDGEDLNAILVSSNDPDHPDTMPFRVDVLANGQEPCILVSDENGIDFSTAFIGGVSTKTVTITNCSQTKELEVSGIRLTNDSDEEFFLDTLPEPLGSGSGPIVLESDKTASFVLNYAPTAEAVNEGALEIISNDPSKSPLNIPIFGRGSNNACPTPIAQAREVGANSPWATELEAGPLGTIEFDGAGSVDPDNPNDPNAISRYEWTIIERPTDSTSNFVPNGTIANPSLFLDLVGRYRVELRVFDAQNTPSCEVATVTILVVPQEDIHVQLVWDTPGDANQTDTGVARGSDVDLHFLHPRGAYNASPWDCYWLNIEPDWG
ncbi:MAG: choice-of-anchor D domain-containing protein, partial [Myxococcota bacterium]